MIGAVSRAGVPAIAIRRPHHDGADVTTLAKASRRACPFVISYGVRWDARDAPFTGWWLPIDHQQEITSPAADEGRLLVSIHDEADVELPTAQRADILVAGHVFATETHPGESGRGLDFVRQIRAKCPSSWLVGIGGITAENAAQVIAAGADGVAVIRCLSRSDNPERDARRLLTVVQLASGLRSRKKRTR